MDAPRRETGWAAPPAFVDAILAAFVTIVGGGFALGGIERGDRPNVIVAATALGVLSGVTVAWRRRYPLWVLWIVQAATTGHLLLARDWPQAGGLAVAVVLYAIALTRDREESMRIAVGVWALNCVLIVVTGAGGGLPHVVGDLFGCTILLAGSWAFGDNRRTRRAYYDSLVERARRLEAEREEQAARAVLDERTRIARELHDAVAHHVSAIAVTAGAAEEVAETDPARALEALRAIRATSRDALEEMRAIIGVLSPTTGAADYAPQPGLGDVDRLVAQTRAAGLPVTLRVEGTPRQLPEAVDLSAYRIVQEALTNTLKHAGGARAEVVVRYGDGDVVLEVSDDGAGASPDAPPAEPAHAGRGLIGMRERVALFHGDLAAGPGPRGGFRVRARLPLGGAAS
ncbi:MAG TPA: sensor histidine kinase [Candidatus Dormibacteraeota bacterium]|nr:sensor histidine kinase [Candidatus Dormibacteraeota bacterium]